MRESCASRHTFPLLLNTWWYWITQQAQHGASRRRAESNYHLPSLLYCMEKAEKKLLKLQKKAQECVSRDKAVKILKKEKKWHKFLKWYLIENDSHYPHRGVKFYHNISTARAPRSLSVVWCRMFTVIHSMKRASEASGFSTGDTIENVCSSVRMLQNVSTACIWCDIVLY